MFRSNNLIANRKSLHNGMTSNLNNMACNHPISSNSPSHHQRLCFVAAFTLLFAAGQPIFASKPEQDSHFVDTIQPILDQHCFDCHGYGSSEGGVAFDKIANNVDSKQQHKVWLAVLDNVRAGLMPPPNEIDPEDRPSQVEIDQLVHWIKFTAFAIDPEMPNPGSVAPRRLNRIEYQNTIRDLMDFKFQADREFPPDDTGGGFDNNSDVLTLSTLLIEKYLAAAETIVLDAVPQSTGKNNKHYLRFFPDGTPPTDTDARDQYADKILEQFASRAFRRPVERSKTEQLTQLARSIYSEPDKSFEQGISRAMMAVLASPRFLFRVDTTLTSDPESTYPLLDEYSLASRLSYFLWSTMPDQELLDLAQEKRLRKELPSQVQRMLADPKTATGLVRNFTGQWLKTRDIDSVEINGKAVLGKGKVNGNRRTKYDFDGKIRSAMRKETERYFAYILSEDRSILEFIDSDYAFLNERLAKQYEIADVKGDKFRLVKLPADSYRGGVLTQGSVLAVTSNPTRTSPVKRGVFILENILGTPPPPPPPNVAELEVSLGESEQEEPTLGDALALHREQTACSSCHDRMDPLGLAFENFLPMGTWRDKEAGKPIQTSGRLITGETFQDVRELKRVLTNERRIDFYRCMSKKIMTYAIGRALSHQDTDAIDRIVERTTKADGRFSQLIMAVIDSPQFQKNQNAQSL